MSKDELPQWAADAGDAQAAIAMENLLAMGDQPVEDRTNWLANFIARALADAAKPKWQPIETAPTDRTILLRAGKIVGSGEYRPLTKWSDERGFCFDGATLPSGATHWLPLPAAPEVG